MKKYLLCILLVCTPVLAIDDKDSIGYWGIGTGDKGVEDAIGGASGSGYWHTGSTYLRFVGIRAMLYNSNPISPASVRAALYQRSNGALIAATDTNTIAGDATAEVWFDALDTVQLDTSTSYIACVWGDANATGTTNLKYNAGGAVIDSQYAWGSNTDFSTYYWTDHDPLTFTKAWTTSRRTKIQYVCTNADNTKLQNGRIFGTTQDASALEHAVNRNFAKEPIIQVRDTTGDDRRLGWIRFMGVDSAVADNGGTLATATLELTLAHPPGGDWGSYSGVCSVTVYDVGEALDYVEDTISYPSWKFRKNDSAWADYATEGIEVTGDPIDTCLVTTTIDSVYTFVIDTALVNRWVREPADSNLGLCLRTVENNSGRWPLTRCFWSADADTLDYRPVLRLTYD
jgi:hypothetical protein